MITLDLEKLEAVMVLMAKHQIDEVQCEEYTIKKHIFQIEKPQQTDQELLAKHLKQLPSEPWMDLPEDAVDSWAKGNS